jgi:hypothetical protein
MAQIQKAKWERQTYVLKIDRGLPEDQQTKWHIKPLAVADTREVHDLLMSDKPASGLMKAFTRGVVGWDNLTDDGKEFPFAGRKYPQDIDGLKRPRPEEIERIPVQWQEEIGSEIVVASEVDESEKN